MKARSKFLNLEVANGFEFRIIGLGIILLSLNLIIIQYVIYPILGLILGTLLCILGTKKKNKPNSSKRISETESILFIIFISFSFFSLMASMM